MEKSDLKTDSHRHYMNSILKQNAGKFKEAYEEIDKAIEKILKYYENHENHLDIAEIYFQKGRCLELLNSDEAYKNYEKSLKIRENLYDNENYPEIGQSLLAMGNNLKHQGLNDEAEIRLKNAKKIFQTVKSEKNLRKMKDLIQVESSLNSITYNNDNTDELFQKADHYFKLLDFKNAESLYIRAGNCTESKNVKAKAYEMMGRCNLYMRNLNKSLDYINKSYDIRKELYKNKDHIDLASSFNSLATYYDECKDYPQSNYFRIKEYELKQKLLKKTDLLNTASINNLGVSYQKINDLDNALKYLKEAFNIRKELSNNGDSQNLDIADSMLNLAVVYYKKGLLSKAIKYATESLEIKLNIFGTINNKQIEQNINIMRFIYHGLSVYYDKKHSQSYLKNKEDDEGENEIDKIRTKMSLALSLRNRLFDKYNPQLSTIIKNINSNEFYNDLSKFYLNLSIDYENNYKLIKKN